MQYDLVGELLNYCTVSQQGKTKNSSTGAFRYLEKVKTRTKEELDTLDKFENLHAVFKKGSTWSQVLTQKEQKREQYKGKFLAKECREINRLLQVYEPSWILLKEMYDIRNRGQKLERIEFILDRVVHEIEDSELTKNLVKQLSGGSCGDIDQSFRRYDSEMGRMASLEKIEKEIDTLMRAVFAYFNKILREFDVAYPVNMGWAELSQGNQTAAFYKTFMEGLFDAVNSLPKDSKKERQESIERKWKKMLEAKKLCAEAIEICNNVYHELAQLLRHLVKDDLTTFYKQNQNMPPNVVGPCGERLVHIIFIWDQGDYLLKFLKEIQFLQVQVQEVGKSIVEGEFSTVGDRNLLAKWPIDELIPEWLSEEFKDEMKPWTGVKEGDFERGGLYTGETVLHIAIANREREIVKKLLDSGVNLSARACGIFFRPKKMYSDKEIAIHRNWCAFESLHKLNKESGCYYGEFPLSFAASVGDTEICYLIVHARNKQVSFIAKAPAAVITEPISIPESGAGQRIVKMTKQERKSLEEDFRSCVNYRSESTAEISAVPAKLKQQYINYSLFKFVGQQDTFGNTALHLAVLHDRHDVIDWLLGIQGMKFCLEVINRDGFTPCTLAVKTGNVALFDRIWTKHMSRTLWEFGKVGCRTTDLSQIDSYRIKESVSETNVHTLQACYDERVEKGAIDFQKFRLDPVKMHENTSWRSAIEIIAEDKIREFLRHPLFLKLINDKWEQFGLRMHLVYRLIPLLWGLALHTTASLMLMSEMQGNGQRYGKIVGSLCVNFTTGGLDFWGGDASVYTSAALRCVLCFAYPAWLVWETRNFQGFAISDLNAVKENPRLSPVDVRLFLFRNLEPILDWLSAAALVAAGVAELLCKKDAQVAAMAVSSIALFCNFLLCLLPFKVIATMIITIYTILLVDVTTFLIIFLIVLAGFTLSMAQLASVYDGGAGGHDGESIMLVMVSVLLGSGFDGVSDLPQGSGLPGLTAVIAYFWVFLCNILLLNFLIASMGDTFTRHKQAITML